MSKHTFIPPPPSDFSLAILAPPDPAVERRHAPAPRGANLVGRAESATRRHLATSVGLRSSVENRTARKQL